MTDTPLNRAARRALNSRRVADRYSVTLRTIPRWVEQGILPPADMVINTRSYWFEKTLDEADRARENTAKAI